MTVDLTARTTSILEVVLGDHAAFAHSRALTETLAAPLAPEDQTAQSMPDASPTKWHRAHTTWFYEEFLLGPAGGYQTFDDGFRYLFNSYYEGVGPRHPRAQRGLVTRPGTGEITRYREHVEDAVSARVGGCRAAGLAPAWPAPGPRPAAPWTGREHMIGDVWEWTASAYRSYPEFQPAPGAVGEYNGKFMCDQHVLRGASCATPSGHERVSYRTFSRPRLAGRFLACGWPGHDGPARRPRRDQSTGGPAARGGRARRAGGRPAHPASALVLRREGQRALLEQITRLKEYYPTRTEESTLVEHAGDIAALSGASTMIELGAGTSRPADRVCR